MKGPLGFQQGNSTWAYAGDEAGAEILQDSKTCWQASTIEEMIGFWVPRWRGLLHCALEEANIMLSPLAERNASSSI